jgi:hypothetical protein
MASRAIAIICGLLALIPSQHPQKVIRKGELQATKMTLKIEKNAHISVPCFDAFLHRLGTKRVMEEIGSSSQGHRGSHVEAGSGEWFMVIQNDLEWFLTMAGQEPLCNIKQEARQKHE